MLTFEIMTLCTEWHRLYIIVNFFFFFLCFPFFQFCVYNFLFLIFLFCYTKLLCGGCFTFFMWTNRIRIVEQLHFTMSAALQLNLMFMAFPFVNHYFILIVLFFLFSSIKCIVIGLTGKIAKKYIYIYHLLLRHFLEYKNRD